MLISKFKPATIVIPRNATEQELFAAKELVKYLHLLCGADIDISEVPKKKNNIFLGSPRRNRYTAKYISAFQFDAVCPGPEGIFIKSFTDSSLVIAGSDDSMHRGTIYAVYEMLESFCGLSFAAYCHPDVNAGDHIDPSMITKYGNVNLFGAFRRHARCDLPYRGAIVQYEDADGVVDHGLNLPFFDWLCKNRYNNIFTWASCYEKLKELGLVDEARRRGLEFTVGHHEASKLFLPAHGNEYFPEHYYETHPEFYRLQEDGTRYEDLTHFGQWIFCSRNEQMIDTLAENMKSWLSKNPAVKIINFPPNDGMAPQCACPKCAPYSKVENYMYVINSVSRKVREVYPNVQIQALAYTDLFECPPNVELDDGVCIMEATWHETGLRSAGKPDGSCLNGTFFEDNLMKWKSAGADVVYYDYYMGVYPARQRLIPMADEIQATCTRMKKLGIRGAATQIEPFNIWNNLFNFFCFARIAYDNFLSFRSCSQLFACAFGSISNPVERILTYLEDVQNGQTDIMHAGAWLMKHINKRKVYSLFERALCEASDVTARNNVRMLRMAFRYSDLETSQPESPQDDKNYASIMEYRDPTGELKLMCEFDSFHYNNPGYGIAIPCKSLNDTTYERDIWYNFE